MEKSEKRWEYCYVTGYTVACDPGHQTLTPYPKTYKRSEMKPGMNLCAHCEYLPTVYLKEMGDDFIVIKTFGQQYTVCLGKSLDTPRKPLDYAYSEATISIKEKE